MWVLSSSGVSVNDFDMMMTSSLLPRKASPSLNSVSPYARAVSNQLIPRSMTPRMTSILSFHADRVMGITPIPNGETRSPVFPIVTLFIASPPGLRTKVALGRFQHQQVRMPFLSPPSTFSYRTTPRDSPQQVTVRNGVGMDGFIGGAERKRSVHSTLC